MSSVSIAVLAREYPCSTESQAAAEYGQKWGYVAIVKYKNAIDGEYTDIGCCSSDEQIGAYFNSPHCHDPELIYDGREQTLLVEKDTLLASRCSLCNDSPNADALIIGSGREYYFCPNCGKFFCPGCYANQLPLTNGTSGVGMCTTCDNEVQKGVPGNYGRMPYKSQPISEEPRAREFREQREIPEDELRRMMDDMLRDTPSDEKKWWQFWK